MAADDTLPLSDTSRKEPHARNDGWGFSTPAPSQKAQAAAPANAAVQPESAPLPDLKKTPKWRDIVGTEKFRALPAEEKTKLKASYFDDFIAPHAGAEAPRAKQEFMRKDFGEVAETPDRTTLEVVGDVVRDAAGAVLKIGPTAVKGAADIYDMAAGNETSNAVSRAMSRGMEAIENTVESENMRRQRQGFQALMEDDAQGVGDMFAYLLDHPSLLLSEGVTTLGSMYLPAGTAKAAGGVAKALGASSATSMKAALAAVMGTTAAQNAADTFKSLESQSLEDRYKGAQLSAAISMLTGIATRGGAEGQIAARLVDDMKSGRVGVEAAKQFFKSVSRETLQEMGEEAGNIAGQIYGGGEVPSPDAIAKQVSFAGALGGIVGGGTDLAMNALDRSAPGRTNADTGPAPAAGATTPPIAPSPPPAPEHPSVLAAETALRELAAEAGIPEEVVLPQKTELRAVQPGESIPVTAAPVYTTMEDIPDSELIEFAQLRREQLRQKRDGMIDVVQTSEGLVDNRIPGAGLSELEAMELDLLESNVRNASALRAYYAFDEQQSAMQEGTAAPEPVEVPPVAMNDVAAPGPAEQAMPAAIESTIEAGSSNAADSELRDLLSEQTRRFQMEGQGKAILDDLAESGARSQDVSNEFWTETFPRLNDDARAKYVQYVKSLSGMDVGSVLDSVDGMPTRTVSKIEELGQFWGEDLAAPEQLEGIERGYVAMMEWANRQRRGLAEREPQGTLPQDIDVRANEAATSPLNGLPEPTEAQKEAGNYRKGHVRFAGLDLTIENPIGSTRSGKGPDGEEWSVDMTAHYGYIKRTTGADGEQIDVYLAANPDPEALPWIFHQYNLDGTYDEDKVVLGARTEEEAKAIYDAHFSDGSGPQRRIGSRSIRMEDFKEWLREPPVKQPDLKRPRSEKPRTEKQRNQQQDYSTKWFGSQGAADTFIKNKRIEETHEAVPNGKRFEIRRKGQGAPAPAADQRAKDAPWAAEAERQEFNFGTGPITVSAQHVFSRERYRDVYGTDGGILSFQLTGDGVDSDTGFKSVAGVTYAGDMNAERLAEMMGSVARQHARKENAPEPEAERVETKGERFSGNKIFTGDKVEAARARVRAKLSQLNAGIDPEMLQDGITIAGAYIESGVRTFSAFAKAMVADFGTQIRPFLRSFYEGVRYYPGFDTAGMTSAAEIDLMEKEGTAEHRKPADSPAVGIVQPKPKRRRERDVAAVMLQHDFGVPHIDGYGTDYSREIGNTTKDAFLKDAVKYLKAVESSLAAAGFTVPKARSKTKSGVHTNEGGVAGSGDVSLVMMDETRGRGVYMTVSGEVSLRGVVPMTKSGVSILMRVNSPQDIYGTKDTNRWMPVDLTSEELAQQARQAVEIAVQSMPAPAKPATEDTPDAGTSQPRDVPAGDPETDSRNGQPVASDREPLVAGLAGESAGPAVDWPVPGRAESADEPGIRSTQPAGTGSPVVVGESGSDGAGSVAAVSADERQPRSGRKQRSRSATGRVEPDLFADPAAAGGTDTDHVIDAEAIGKGGLGQKYRDNVAAIRLLKSLESENRTATPEERKTLAKYVGWGAMKGPFDPASKQWASQHAELKELLSEQEFAAARRSTLDAHFTSPVAVKAMYGALRRLGFSGGRVLEPSVGVGNFLGLMPADMRRNTQVHGVELDSLTSRLVAALYPSAKVAKATGFQDFDIPAEFFDVVIGNPPFGNQPLVDMERSEYSGFSIHNYFLAKSIDKLRPGGLMQVVVSRYFLDAQDSRARDWIAERAKLIGAVRLPNTAFKENAGTEVVTDILIFQKKDEQTADEVGAWRKVQLQQNLNPKTGDYADHRVNELFVNHPELVLGKPQASGSMYSADEYTVEQTGDIADQLAAWVKTLPSQVFSNIDRRTDRALVDMAVPDGLKVGSFYVDTSGKIMQRDADVLGDKRAIQWTPPNQAAVERMKGMIELRDLLRAQMRMERDAEASSEAIEKNRAALKKAYDAFVKKFGFLNSPTNRRVFFDDTESPLVLALEFDYDAGISKATAEREGIEPKDPRATPADILTRRVAYPPQDYFAVQTAKDALLASLNYRGRLDTAYMEEVYGKGIKEIVEELGDLVYQDPERGYVTADEYLSGDVKTKLQEAQLAAGQDATYQRNVAALEKVIPKDKKPSEISVSVGAAFVPAEIYEEFAQHITGTKPSMAYISATGQWVAHFEGQGDPSLTVGRYGTEHLNSKTLFNLLLLGKGAVVKETVKTPGGGTTTYVLEVETEAAREKQNAIKAEWQKWLWSDPARADRIATLYNEKMNRIVVREFNGEHMSFPGMNPAITLLRHQKDGVWRGLQSFQVLYDHVVGAGKTFEMAALAMEMKRLGIARKPVFAVPNHLTLQWRSEINRLYPGARVLAAVPSDFSKENREKLFSKIITGDWDAVVIGHSSLKKIGLPAATETAVLEEQASEVGDAIEAMKRDRGDKHIIRDMEKIRSNLQSKLKERLAAVGSRSKVVTFDELGLDALFVDEMHEFKNLAYLSTMDRTPGMGNPAGSAKAFDLFVKVRWLFDTFGEKAPLITATGTPVSNSLVEMYNMQRYMQYPTLKSMGLHVFDAWAKQFGNIENVYEVAPSGSGYRQSTRFSKFTNLPALMSLYNSFADTVTLDDLKAQEVAQGRKFPVPKIAGGKPTNIVAERSPAVAEFMGVPRAALDEYGDVVFDIDPEEARIEQSAESGKWIIKAGNVYVGNLETEQDARLKLVEQALSPRVAPDPESILGQFANLRELTRSTKGKINALSLTNLANKAGLDYRLIDPAAADFPGSKINLAVDRMWGIYQQWTADRGTQLVFCDLSIPNSARASYATKPHKLYVRNSSEQLEVKSGTMHVVEGFEYLPFFVVKRGAKDEARFSVYDAKSGQLVGDDYRSKEIAIGDVAARLGSESGLEAWTQMRNTGIDITQDEIDEYNNENGVELTDTSGYLMMDDVEGAASSGKFSVYDDIKAKLIRKGVPEAEIAFIHDYNTPVSKDKLFKSVKEGRVRFLLGSTPKMGAGTNVQDRLVGLHHIDAPWRPSDLEQREGRIIRRGNMFYARDPDGFEVFIGRYATAQTYDTRRWQILEHKARGIEQLRNYDGTTTEIDDIDGEAANAADMKAAASGDPLILEETKLRNEVRRLERLQVAHADEVLSMVRRAREAKDFVERKGPERLALYERMVKTADQNPPDEKGWAAPKVVLYKHGADKDAVYKAVSDAFERVKAHISDRIDVTYRGFTFALEHVGLQRVAIVLPHELGTHSIYSSNENFSPTGFVQRLKNFVDGLPANVEGVRARMSKLQEEHVSLLEQSREPFAQESELEDARRQHQAVRRALMAKGPEVPPEQKELVDNAIEGRKKQLRSLGYGEAIDELFRAGNNAGSLREPADPDYGDPYRNFATRPGTTERQKSEGRNALKALFRRVRADSASERLPLADRGEGNLVQPGDGYRVLGRRLPAELSIGKVGTLVGAVVASPHDLAVLAQVYRDPRFETFRVIFTDGRRIVGESGYSSRLPASVAVPEHLYAFIRQGKDRYRADGYYLVHNHPSGRATPSVEDERETRRIAARAPGFLGHVVIDFNEYAVINATGASELVSAPELGGVDFTSTPSDPHPILGKVVKTGADVARIGKEVQVQGAHATLVMLDASSRVQLLVDVPMGVLGDTSRKGLTVGKAAIRKMARDSGSGGNRFLVLPAGADVNAFRPWLEAGVFRDVVTADGDSAARDNATRSVDDFMESGRSRSVSEGRRGVMFYENADREFAATDAFRLWFGDSKVVNEKGDPLVVYHGTTADFDTFKAEHIGDGNGNADWGDGFYFASNPAAASTYAEGEGGNVMPVYLKMLNPATNEIMLSDDVQDAIDDGMGATSVREVLEELGYDGIAFKHKRGGTEYVVFNADQIKSAIGNDGSFSAVSDSILRERLDNEYDPGGSIGRKAQRVFTEWMQRTPDNLRTFGLYDKSLATQYHKALKDRHFAQVFSLSIALQNEISTISIRPAEKAPGLLPKVDNVRAAAAQLVHGRKGGDTVTKVAHAVFAGTLAGENVMEGTIWTDPQLREKFGLDDVGVSLYHQARAAIDTSLDELAAAEAFAAARGYVPPSMRPRIISSPGKAREILTAALEKQAAVLERALANAIRGGNDYAIESLAFAKNQYDKTRDNVNAIFTTVDNLKEAGYAPLMRFGRYSVTVQEIDPETGAPLERENGRPVIVFHAKYETEREAKAAARRFEKLYADDPGKLVRAGADSELGHELYTGISPETIALFGQSTGVDLQEYYRLALAERSALKRRIERSGAPGFSRDLPRVLANFITSNARHAARQYYLMDISNAIRKIPQKKGDVKDEAIKLKKFMLDPSDRGATASSIMFVWFLGGAIDSAIVNITQPYVATFPHLTQFTSLKKAWKAMSAAAPFALGRKEITDKALREALARAGQEGIVDAQEVFHLYSIGSQNVSAIMANALSNLPGIGKKIKAQEEDVRARVSAFLAIWGSMFAAAEKFNRRLTFIAAWNVAKARNMRDPYAFAVRAVNETQGIYNKVNRPNLARSGVGRVVLTFKQFTIFMMEKMARQALKQGPEGRRAVLLFLALIMLAAGEEGLPFMQDINDLIDTLGQLLGYNTNMVRTKRRAAHDMLGETLGDLFLYGASSALPLDFHGRLGFGNLIPGTGMLKPSSEELRGSEVADVFGPAVGIAEQVVDAYDAAAEGNTMQALMNLSPRAVKNVAAGLDMAVSGYARDTRGRRTVDVGLADALVKMAGFTPTVVAENSRRTAPIYQDIALQKKTETSIIDEWARGAVAGDNDMVVSAQERLSDWNRSNPETPIVVTPAQIRSRVETLTSGKDDRIFRMTPREMRGEVGLDLVD